MTPNDDKYKNHTNEPGEGEFLGRTFNSDNPAVDKASAKADISAVDQQEGNMDNGETGPDSFSENKEDSSAGGIA